MWAWGIGGLATAGGVLFLMTGGPGGHCGPCLGRASAADARVAVAPPAAPTRRTPEPPLARVFRDLPAGDIVPAAHAEPAGPRYSSPADPF